MFCLSLRPHLIHHEFIQGVRLKIKQVPFSVFIPIFEETIFFAHFTPSQLNPLAKVEVALKVLNEKWIQVAPYFKEH